MKELNNDNDVNFLPSNIISEKILISDNTIFKEKINDFLIDLESKYKDFISKSFNIQNNWKEFQQNKKNYNVFIMPEQMLIKSPTTFECSLGYRKNIFHWTNCLILEWWFGKFLQFKICIYK